MTTIKDKIAASSSFLEELDSEVSLTKEEVINSFLDDVISLGKEIEKHYTFFEKATQMFEEMSWYEDDGSDFDEELVNQLKSLNNNAIGAHNTGIRVYVMYNNTVKNLVPSAIKRFKNALDDFKETIKDVFDTILIDRNDPEYDAIDERIKNL